MPVRLACFFYRDGRNSVLPHQVHRPELSRRAGGRDLAEGGARGAGGGGGPGCSELQQQGGRTLLAACVCRLSKLSARFVRIDTHTRVCCLMSSQHVSSFRRERRSWSLVPSKSSRGLFSARGAQWGSWAAFSTTADAAPFSSFFFVLARTGTVQYTALFGLTRAASPGSAHPQTAFALNVRTQALRVQTRAAGASFCVRSCLSRETWFEVIASAILTPSLFPRPCVCPQSPPPHTPQTGPPALLVHARTGK